MVDYVNVRDQRRLLETLIERLEVLSGKAREIEERIEQHAPSLSDIEEMNRVRIAQNALCHRISNIADTPGMRHWLRKAERMSGVKILRMENGYKD